MTIVLRQRPKGWRGVGWKTRRVVVAWWFRNETFEDELMRQLRKPLRDKLTPDNSPFVTPRSLR